MWNTSLKFVRLPWQQKEVVLQSILALPLIHVGLRVLGFKRLLSVMQRLAPIGAAPDFSLEHARTYAYLFSAVVRRSPLPLRCLERSVALCWILRRKGLDAKVHIGVRTYSGGLNAHAWVQCGNRVLNDSDNVYREYDRFDSQALSSKVQWL
jgi:hypothetical protein